MLPGCRIVGRIPIDLWAVLGIFGRTQRCSGPRNANGQVTVRGRDVIGQIRAQVLGPVIKRVVGQTLTATTRGLGSIDSVVRQIGARIGLAIGKCRGERISRISAASCRILPRTVSDQQMEILSARQNLIGSNVVVGIGFCRPAGVGIAEIITDALGGRAIRRAAGCGQGQNMLEQSAALRDARRSRVIDCPHDIGIGQCRRIDVLPSHAQGLLAVEHSA